MEPKGTLNGRVASGSKRSTTAVKKGHKVKNDLVVGAQGRVLYLRATYGGSVHDKTIVDTEGWQFPAGILLHQDLGFKGHRPAGVRIMEPVKKPSGKELELSADQKPENKNKAPVRVKMERCIGRVKIFRILKDRIRLYKKGIKIWSWNGAAPSITLNFTTKADLYKVCYFLRGYRSNYFLI